MASCLSRSFVPATTTTISSWLSSSSSSSSSSTTSISISAAPQSQLCIARRASGSLTILGAKQAQEQEQEASSTGGGDHGRSGGVELRLAARRGSRREMLGLGAMLAATTGVGMAIATPETSAATGECAELTLTPSGLAFCDTAVGSGISASKGLLIKAHYSGRLENGKVFDSSYKRGKPLVFRIGVGEVIRGWDQGILGSEEIPPMLAGGKRTLRIPAKLAYGERGIGCSGGSCLIPPNSTLIFDVEFVGKA